MTGEELKRWRKHIGWTQADLMEELGVTSRQTLSTWENSKEVPRLVELAITALDRIEACRRRSGFEGQMTLEQIAARRHTLWKKSVGAE